MGFQEWKPVHWRDCENPRGSFRRPIREGCLDYGSPGRCRVSKLLRKSSRPPPSRRVPLVREFGETPLRGGNPSSVFHGLTTGLPMIYLGHQPTNGECSMTMREWKQKIQRDMERSWGETFYGIAIPCKKTHVNGSMVQSEKVLKFNKKAMRDCNETDWKREDKLRR